MQKNGDIIFAAFTVIWMCFFETIGSIIIHFPSSHDHGKKTDLLNPNIFMTPNIPVKRNPLNICFPR